MKKTIVIFFSLFTVLLAEPYYYENGQKVEVFPSTQKKSANKNLLHFSTKEGKAVSFKKNEILVQCKENLNCVDLLNGYKFESTTKLTKSIYLVTLTEQQDIFEYFELLKSNDGVLFANPNFSKQVTRR